MASGKREGRGEREERREESERLGREERERRSLSAAVAHALLKVTRVYFSFTKLSVPRMRLCNTLDRKNGINALPSIMGWITSNTEKCSRVLGREVAYWIKSSRFESLLEARACDFFTLLV